MSQADEHHKLRLDEPGSAGPSTLWRSAVVGSVIVALAIVIMASGRIQLPPYPPFTLFHATFSFVVDIVTAFLLFGQFVYCRLRGYAVLGAAFLFSALAAIPFLFTFPGAILAEAPVIGGPQSSIWIWHLWHILFPAMIAAALLVHQRSQHTQLERITPVVEATVSLVVVAVVVMTVAVTLFHDRLPVLYAGGDVPLTPAFYWTGGAAAVVTAAALGLALPMASQRSVLHIWIVMVLLALLADVGASLAAYDRYTVGWYFGRVEAMLASSVLFVVFLSDVSRLYRNMVSTLRKLAAANDEKERLLAEVYRREQEFEALAERAPDIIVRVDAENRIRYVNPAIEKVVSKRREWIQGQPLEALGAAPDELAARKRALRQVFESGRELVREREETGAGGTRYYQARLVPEFGEDGRVVSVLVLERDISDLKRAQFALERLSLHDPLTGIANRRYLDEFVEREWRREVRYHHSVAVIMVDIDHFKAYNDHYGHQQGDTCLREVAQALQAHLRRPSDFLARYGGEEFAVVLLETDLAAARAVAEVMHRAVLERQLPHAASPIVPVVTVSVGVAAAPAHRITFPELMHAADQALYRAKAAGRNRVEAVQPLPHET